jgi:hypothetical protein
MDYITESYTLTIDKDDLLKIVEYYVKNHLNGRVTMVQKLLDTKAVAYSHPDNVVIAVTVDGRLLKE